LAPHGPGGFTWNVYYSGALQTIKVISSEWLSTLPYDGRIGHIGCIYDLYFYCEYGLVAIFVIGGMIALIGFLLIRSLNKQSLYVETR